MVEFEENFNGEEDVKLDTNRVFEVRKRFLGVTREGNKWRARIRHPKLKFKVSLGYYSTPEEAALVVNKKKAEFEEMFKDENSMNVVEFEEKFKCKEDLKLDINGASEVRKRFIGVCKKGNKWRARIQHPKLKFEVSLGYYSTPEEAALVVTKKKAEFEEMFKGENSMNVDDIEGNKLPPGVRRTGYRRWGARIRHPLLKYKVSLGSYDTPEEAAIAVENKRAEFLNMYGRTPYVKPDFNESKDSEPLEKPKRYVGVIKKGNRWQARIYHPKLKFAIYLGCYNTPEEAAFAVQMKKTEFEDTFQVENGMDVESCKGDFEGKKLPPGVYRRGDQRWGARIWNPELKCDASLGSYNSPEEAAIAVKHKKIEFLKIYGCSSKVKPGYIDHDISDEPPGDELKVPERPEGVSKLESGKWRARIKDQKSSPRICLGSSNNAEEVVKSLNKGKAELAIEREMAEFDRLHFRPKTRPGFEASDVAMKIECADSSNIASVINKFESKFVPCILTPVYESENSNSADVGDSELAIEREMAEFDRLQFGPKTRPGFEASDGPMKIECADSSNIASVIDRFESKFVPCILKSVYEPENSNSADVGDAYVTRKENGQNSGCNFDFEKATSLGFINEYGQLVGEYSNLDEHMSFSVPDEDTAEAG